MLSWFTNQLRKKLLQQAEHSAQLEVQLLQQEAQYLHLLQQQEEATCKQCMAAAAEASQAMRQLLDGLEEALYGGEAECGAVDAVITCSSTDCRSNTTSHDSNSSSSSSQAQWLECLSGLPAGAGTAAGSGDPRAANAGVGAAASSRVVVARSKSRPQSSWLHKAVGTMIRNLQHVAAAAAARAELIAARQDVAVQSDEPLQAEWMRYIAAVSGSAAATNALHQKAIAEAIVRIYVRGLHQLEATWAHELQQRQGRPGSRMSGYAAGDGAGLASGGPGGGVSSLFETMMAHYTQQQHGQHGQRQAWQMYDASLWKDPQVSVGGSGATAP